MRPKHLLGVLILAVIISAGATTPLNQQPPPAAEQVGHVQLTFAERSPLSSVEALRERNEETIADLTPSHLAHIEYDLSNESFDVWVPTNSERNVPLGLFVWVGVTQASGEWLDVLARHKMIFIAANTYGRTAHQEGMALDAVLNMKKRYAIDESRIYVSGFSAGGQRATWIIRRYTDIFRGGFFMMGGYFYHNLPIDNKRWEPTTVPSDPQWNVPIEPLKTTMKILIMKGADDQIWKAPEGQADYEALTLDGFTRVNYVEIPLHGHNHPDAQWFEKGLIALESEPRKPPTTRPSKETRLQPGQIAQAKRLVTSAEYWSHYWAGMPKGVRVAYRDRYEERARGCLLQVLADYPTSASAKRARELLNQLDQLAATRASSRPTTRAAKPQPGT
jgi:hypothetical protein